MFQSRAVPKTDIQKIASNAQIAMRYFRILRGTTLSISPLQLFLRWVMISTRLTEWNQPARKMATSSIGNALDVESASVMPGAGRRSRQAVSSFSLSDMRTPQQLQNRPFQAADIPRMHARDVVTVTRIQKLQREGFLRLRLKF